MASASGTSNAKQDAPAKTPWLVGWRSELWQLPLWCAFFFGSIVFTGAGVEFLLQQSVAAAWVAGFAYTALMPVFVLSPGRGSRGFSPFSPVVRHALPGLVRLHLLCVSVFMSIVALHESTSPYLGFVCAFNARHPDAADACLIGGPVLLVLVQGVRSSDLLDRTRELLKPKDALPDAAPATMPEPS